ncbi:TatD family hydrolase [Paraglaciecola sp. L3A3]|uniref:TatD family hydrolase n=1 Tax=Paraglaciecola sp. L3A3 TaxID=2686358 RepID=UPI00131AD0D1|nr:TatD family hydrolase [Paraglaciecola sp. L3A3]
MYWCDIGVNFTDNRLAVEPVLARAVDAKVQQIIITGTSEALSCEALDLTRSHPTHLFATAGVHPHHSKEFNSKTLDTLRQLASSPQVVAIGECGLDFNRNFSSPEQQLHAFEQQLKLACELQLPVFLHERDAFEQQIKLLEKYQTELVGGVAHCFTGNRQQMSKYLDLGFYIGITGWVCDPKRGESLRHAIQELPIQRLLLETDAPYLRPKGLANNRKLDKGNNEPAYLPYVAEQVATIMNVDINTLNQACITNTQSLFGLPKVESQDDY